MISFSSPSTDSTLTYAPIVTLGLPFSIETNVGLLISALSATCSALNFLGSLASLIFSPRTEIVFCALGNNMMFLFFVT